MIRDDYETLPTAEWTLEEARDHLEDTFERSAKEWPDLMEPYVVMLADANPDMGTEIMRQGLRETVLRRYESRFEEGDRANGTAQT